VTIWLVARHEGWCLTSLSGMSCLCESESSRKSDYTPLHPIPVGGPFQRVAVDVLQLPPTVNGNCYVVVFMDYLTKCPEAYATSDQTAKTNSMFVEQIVSCHGIPQELLSDRGQNFLSTLMQEVGRLFASENTEHLRLSSPNGWISWKIQLHPDWDDCKMCIRQTAWLRHQITLFAACLPFLSSGINLWVVFYLVCGRDPRIPTSTVLSQKQSVYSVDVDDYKHTGETVSFIYLSYTIFHSPILVFMQQHSLCQECNIIVSLPGV